MSVEFVIPAVLISVVTITVIAATVRKWEEKEWKQTIDVAREAACGTVVILSTFVCTILGVIFFAEFLTILARRLANFVNSSSSSTPFDYDQHLENTLIIGDPSWAIGLFIFSYYCIQRFKLPTPQSKAKLE